MTEAVILALIALCGMVMFSITALIIVAITLKAAPTHIQLNTEFGSLDVDYNNRVDE